MSRNLKTTEKRQQTDYRKKINRKTTGKKAAARRFTEEKDAAASSEKKINEKKNPEKKNAEKKVSEIKASVKKSSKKGPEKKNTDRMSRKLGRKWKNRGKNTHKTGAAAAAAELQLREYEEQLRVEEELRAAAEKAAAEQAAKAAQAAREEAAKAAKAAQAEAAKQAAAKQAAARKAETKKAAGQTAEKPQENTCNAQNERIGRACDLPSVPASNGKIRIIPLGGLEQIGMNITAFESEHSIVIVDCGMAFPNEDMPGVDLVIPDVTYLKEHMDKIEGFFITHGHEDHIGALPYVLKEMNVPVFSTRLTRALIENKLREHGMIESAKLNTVSFGDCVEAGDFAVEFIKTNHSIQDAAALAIHSPAGVILHTGDFKVDYTPVFGDTIDLQRFAELGKQGILALLCDSTNATRQGFTMSERTVGHTFEAIFGEHTDKRIIVATFASNVDRVQQVITVAEKYDRKVVIDGRSMINIIGTAAELGYIRIREGTLIDISEVKNYPDDKVVLIVTGSQGESMAALSRMATGQHRKITLSSNDVIVMSSTPIPGNEKAVSKVINELSRRRTKVIYQDTHVSGHACVEELKLIYALVHPKFSIPVHGELRHRLAQKEVALALGVPKENCYLVDTGDVIELTADSCRIIDKVQAGQVMVDGLGVGDVGNAVLKDRQSLSQNGIIVVAVSLEKGSGQILAGPEIVTRGLIYVKENEEIIDESREVVIRAIDECRKYRDMARVRNTIKNRLSDYIWRKINRTPLIMPVITEV